MEPGTNINNLCSYPNSGGVYLLKHMVECAVFAERSEAKIIIVICSIHFKIFYRLVIYGNWNSKDAHLLCSCMWSVHNLYCFFGHMCSLSFNLVLFFSVSRTCPKVVLISWQFDWRTRGRLSACRFNMNLLTKLILYLIQILTLTPMKTRTLIQTPILSLRCLLFILWHSRNHLLYGSCFTSANVIT